MVATEHCRFLARTTVQVLGAQISPILYKHRYLALTVFITRETLFSSAEKELICG